MFDLGYYDRQGARITMDEWCHLSEDPAYHHVQRTIVRDVYVSTIWLGLDHGFHFDGRYHSPIIFETMAFRGNGPGRDELCQLRWCTEAQATEGHWLTVAEYDLGTLTAKGPRRRRTTKRRAIE